MINEIKGPVSITGIRLNDVRYFQPHPPHPRKKMTIMRVIPKALVFPDSSDKPRDTSSIICSRTKNLDKVLINQRSEEVATFFYSNCKISENSKELKTQNREVQTEIEPPALKIKSLQPVSTDTIRCKRTHQVGKQATIIKVPSNIADSPTSENDVNLEKELATVYPEPLVTEEEEGDSKAFTEDENSRKSSWWRAGFLKQIFVDFFLQLLGRKDVARKKSRENMTERYSVATSTKDRGQKVGRTERKDCRKHRTKKSYDSTQHKKRTKRCRGDEVFFDLIRLTHDENLRATILEQALRTRRLEEENARFRKKLDEKLKTRQRSSPLY